MQAEATWFASAPVPIRPFLPKVIRAELPDAAGYAIEYLPLVPLNELFVFGRLPAKVWRKIFRACDHYLCAARSVPVPAPPARIDDKRADGNTLAADPIERLYRAKTVERLDTFARQTGIDLDLGWRFGGRALPSLHRIAEDAAALALSQPAVPSFLHGDLCFSNILFDFRADRIKLIDPRGLDAEGRITPFGDLRYDMAKLAHSVLGLYDVIIAGRYVLQARGHDLDFEVYQPNPGDVGDAFRGTRFAGRTPLAWNAMPIMVLLFLSMLPLHVDHPPRQRALMANALRLYEEMFA